MFGPKILPRTRITKTAAIAFWKDYDAGKRKSTRRQKPWFDQTGARTREPVAVTSRTIGVVRNFNGQDAFRAYLRKVSEANRLGLHTRFAHFDFCPTHVLILDPKNFRVVEQGFRAPSIADVLEACKEWYGVGYPRLKPFTVRKVQGLPNDSLYGQKFIRMMSEKNISPEELDNALHKTYYEIMQKIHYPLKVDTAESNLLVLNYNPKTKRPLIAIVDHFGGDVTRIPTPFD